MNLAELVHRIEVLIRAIWGEIKDGYVTIENAFSGRHSDLTDIEGTLTHQQIDEALRKTETDPVFQQWLDSNPLAGFLTNELDPVFLAWLATNPLSSFLTSELDPVFLAWLATNPLAGLLTSETDPAFTAWLLTNPLYGFVKGPASATPRTVPVYDNETGKLIGNTNVLVDESGQMFIQAIGDGKVGLSRRRRRRRRSTRCAAPSRRRAAPR